MSLSPEVKTMPPGGKQNARYTHVIHTLQNSLLQLRRLFLLSSALVLTACAATAPASSLSSSSAPTKEKPMMTSASTETRLPKRSLDGSKPFTMPEIEDRLLKLFALPPVQMSIKAVERIFGVVLQNKEIPTFYEEISDDRQVAFSINAFDPVPGGTVFNYDVKIKSTNSDGQPIMDSDPAKIPAAYKLSYLDFAQKLQARGWQADGGNRAHGYYWKFFQKNGYLITMRLDGQQIDADGKVDYGKTRIVQIMVDKNID